MRCLSSFLRLFYTDANIQLRPNTQLASRAPRNHLGFQDRIFHPSFYLSNLGDILNLMPFDMRSYPAHVIKEIRLFFSWNIRKHLTRRSKTIETSDRREKFSCRKSISYCFKAPNRADSAVSEDSPVTEKRRGTLVSGKGSQ